MSTVTVVSSPQTDTPQSKAPEPHSLRYRFRKIWRVVLFAALFPFFQADLISSIIPSNPSPDVIRFLAGMITLIPLATFIEVVTEDLIERLGQLVGGLMHAFFGNIAFFAISISTLVVAFNSPQAKQNELVGVVQSSIAGTIIIDLLFILGVSILVGGFRNGRMQFSAEYSNQYAEMITVAVIALALPSLGSIIGIGVGTNAATKLDPFEVSTISNVTAVVLIIAYIGYLGWTVFHFRDRAARPQNPEAVSESLSGDLIGPLAASVGPIEEEQQREQLSREALSNMPTLHKGDVPTPVTAVANAPVVAHAHLSNADIINERIHQKIVEDRGAKRTRAEQEELDVRRGIALWEIAILIMGTAGVVFISDKMAESLREVLSNGSAHSLGLSPFFIGFIIVPISSNLVELSAAASSAWHDRMETCLAVTAGSAIQVALLVAPALILVSHVLGLTSMNLVFGLFILAIFALIAYLFQIITVDGETTWLEGLQLTSFFAVIAGVAFFAGAS